MDPQGESPQESKQEAAPGRSNGECGSAAWAWLGRLSRELHWSLVFAVVAVYGACQGVGDALAGVATNYYWKDVQRVQPSASQFYQGVANVPWIIKPIWGLLTDVVPIAGYRRRPYFVLAGVMGVSSMLTLALHRKLVIMSALLALTARSTGAAMADVTVDALVAQNSITHPPLASDMPSLCGLSSSVGALLGFSVSGLLVHAIGSQGVLGLLSIPSALVFSVGILLKESHTSDSAYEQVHKKFFKAIQSMWTTLKCPEVWRPCVYMYMCLALNLDVQGGMFYWYTDSTEGPAFSEGFIGLVYSIGSVGSLLGVLLYQNILKDYPFRSLLLWSQLLSSSAGMLDLILVTRLNLKVGIPDYYFAVIDNSVSQMVGNLKWMPLLVLCSKLCPAGIEGTFFALLMSIQNAGLLTSSWWGGLLLHLLNVTRIEFSNLWVAVLIRNISRLLPLLLLFLVPQSDHNSTILPAHMLQDSDHTEEMVAGADSTELTLLAEEDKSRSLSPHMVAEMEKFEVLEAEVVNMELIPLVWKN